MAKIKVQREVEVDIPDYFRTENHFYKVREDGRLTSVYVDDEMQDATITIVHSEIIEIEEIKGISMAEFDTEWNKAMEVLSR